MGISNDRVDLVFVGGGPATLATATQTKILNPDANIIIYERHTHYQRDHNLQLEQGSFNNFPQDERIQKIVQNFFQVDITGFGSWVQSIAKSWLPGLFPATAHIRTSKIESQFKTLAVDLGIEFRYETIDLPKDLIKRFPNIKAIVGGDGFHSETRKQVFTEIKLISEDTLNELLHVIQKKDSSITLEELKTIVKEEHIELFNTNTSESRIDEVDALYHGLLERHQNTPIKELLSILINRLSHEKLPYREDLQYLAELKYTVPGDAGYSNFLLEAYPTQKILNTIVQEHIGQQINGLTPITLSAFVDKHTFDILNGKATFKHPLGIDDPLIPKKLKKVFETWLKLREQRLTYSLQPFVKSFELVETERPIERQNLKVTVTRLQSYRSDHFIKQIAGVTWYLVGDAAAGVPFRKNYNAIGLPSSSKLAHVLAQLLRLPLPTTDITDSRAESLSRERQKLSNSYTDFVEEITQTQFSSANVKNSTIESSKLWLDVSRRVPWQVIKIDSNRLGQPDTENRDETT